MSGIIPAVIGELYHLNKRRSLEEAVFKVWGNCGKCKTRIEKSVRVVGVRKAIWNMDTKSLTVKFNPKIISLEKIHELIAEAGHDTEELYAHKKAFQSLPKCCKYTRDK